MPDEPRKPVPKEPHWSLIRTFGFGLMLLVWWVITIELPGRNLFKIISSQHLERAFAPITVWAYGVTQLWMQYRTVAVVFIVLAMLLHYWLWYRRTRYDIYGKWLFRMGFLVLYIILYGYFISIFVGAELPIWTWPSNIGPVESL